MGAINWDKEVGRENRDHKLCFATLILKAYKYSSGDFKQAGAFPWAEFR